MLSEKTFALQHFQTPKNVILEAIWKHPDNIDFKSKIVAKIVGTISHKKSLSLNIKTH